jgi:hypothetical protein
MAAPFPLIIAGAALAGFLLALAFPQPAPPPLSAPAVSPWQTLRTATLWLAIWILPLLAITALFGSDHVLSGINSEIQGLPLCSSSSLISISVNISLLGCPFTLIDKAPLSNGYSYRMEIYLPI